MQTFLPTTVYKMSKKGIYIISSYLEAKLLYIIIAVTVTFAATVRAHQAHVILVVVHFTVMVFGPLSTKFVVIAAVWLELMLVQY